MFYSLKKLSQLAPTMDRSLMYWQREAKRILAKGNKTVVEVVRGNKTDSKVLARGQTTPPKHVHVIIASSGGKWGKSRRDYK